MSFKAFEPTKMGVQPSQGNDTMTAMTLGPPQARPRKAKEVRPSSGANLLEGVETREMPELQIYHSTFLDCLGWLGTWLGRKGST